MIHNVSTHSHRPKVLLSTLAVGVSIPVALAGVALPAVAAHTPLPSSVALVGSFQDELGCPGEWQPECAATRMQPVPGAQGIFRGTFDIPAGNYEFKVVLNESWAENYGADGVPGGGNILLRAPGGPVTFTYDHQSHRLVDDLPDPMGAAAAGHWLSTDTLAWAGQAPAGAASFRLYTAHDGGLALANGQITGGTRIELEPTGPLGTELAAKYPHLAAAAAFRLPADVARKAPELLKGQNILAALDSAGAVMATTGLQIPGVLDDVYSSASKRQLGQTWHGKRPQLDLWAPTARSVTLHVYEIGSGGEAKASIPMKANPKEGIWSAVGEPGWQGDYYLFEVEVFVPETGKVERNLVTDPYSVGLSTNSERSLLVDLADPSLAPEGWAGISKPVVDKPEDLSIYELHPRDFSASDSSVPAADRGTYKAFTHEGSDGMRRLKQMTDAGINAVHLLPVNDIATIEERRSLHAEPQCDLSSLPPDSEEQQACVGAAAAKDGFNWGYDPLHYATPEGSYSTDPEGAARTLEFRQMVAALNKAGARVIQDVVYNHTSGSGQNSPQNLDRIVPGYYHRLNPATGAVETSTCCANTATENTMMGKLMVDTLVTLAKTYKLDGFRFDLMGHHTKQNLLDVRAALDELTIQRDGVDGKNIYLYGEGWDFGEVAGNARFVQATQKNMAGTGIGTFNDRLRDAVRGGTPFDEDPRIQGFATGLFTDPNPSPANGSPAEQHAALLLAQDQLKVGLTGNLKDYSFMDRTGATVKGSDITYRGAPAGYNEDPEEAITYVDAHDNETLFDALTLKLPQDTSMEDRIRANTLALSTTAFSQGVSFWHAGTENLRSKSLDRNSYDSGDWFNVLDHTGTTNGFARGLPPERDNRDKYPYMQPLLADPALNPQPAQIAVARERAEELLEIRKSTPLFHLADAHLIQQKLSFPTSGPEQTPGVIVMQLDDTAGIDVDPELKGLVVVFNASDETTTQTIPETVGTSYTLHPLQTSASDPIVKAAAHHMGNGSFTVPARTVAVFQAK